MRLQTPQGTTKIKSLRDVVLTVDFHCVLSWAEAILYVRKVKIASSIALGHAAALKQTTAKYPIRRVDCKVLTIPGGFGAFNPDNIFLGRIPKRLVLGLVDAEAYKSGRCLRGWRANTSETSLFQV